jgi:predicted ATPase
MRFVGRERDLAELNAALARPDIRLVSVLGPGGAGKTRLAVEVASRQLARFVDGVHLVPLAFQDSAEGVLSSIAEVLGLPFSGIRSTEQRLQDYLRTKRVLLILDACEHIREGSELVEGLLEAAPGLKVLVTSRLVLNAPSEHPYPIAGLDLPDQASALDPLESGAVRLYLQAARRVRPGFGVDSGDLGHILRICDLVQGMPLGILLAAAWMQALPPAKVRVELEQSLDRLAMEPPGVPGPTRGIRGAFDLTWDWLTSREQRVLKGLSRLRNGFTRREAQEATDASLYDLMSLVSRSLLYRTPEGQYQVHRLLGQYAVDKLARSPGGEREAWQTGWADGASTSHRNSPVSAPSPKGRDRV